MLDLPVRDAALRRDGFRRNAVLPSILPLAVEDLSYAVADKQLLQVERLEIRAGGPTAFMGPNGAGKSMLLRLLHGLIEPNAGSVRYGGRTMDASIRRRQAMVFQRPVLLRRSVAANIDYALRAGGVARAHRSDRLAELLGLGAFAAQARQPARTLSGGEQQRLALIRAIACQPEILFLDEPTSSLDPAATQMIENLVLQSARAGTKIVLVTHDLGQARRLADEVVFLHRGRVIEQASASRFVERPQSRPARDFLAGKLVL